MKLKTYKRINGIVTRVVPIERDKETHTLLGTDFKKPCDYIISPVVYYCPKTGVSNAN